MKALKFIGIGFAILLGLLVCVCVEENWRGRRAWEECKRDLEQHGEQLEVRAFIRVPVPDDQNCAMAPIVAPLNDYVKDPTSGKQVPRNPEAVERLKRVDLNKLNVHADPIPSRSAWQLGKLVGVGEWQRWLIERQ